MTFYSGLATTATNLLTDKGQSITFSREVSSSFDPVLGVPTTSTTTFSGVGAAFGYKQNQIDGEIIQRGDIRLILEATSTAPLIGDACPIDSVVYKVLFVEKISPAGTPVIYKLQLRA